MGLIIREAAKHSFSVFCLCFSFTERSIQIIRLQLEKKKTADVNILGVFVSFFDIVLVLYCLVCEHTRGLTTLNSN